MSSAPLPDFDWDLTREFWRFAKKGKFSMPRCERCGRFVWYPEERCPHCGVADIPWVQVDGRGSLFSWAEVHHPLYPAYQDDLPYITGIVALAIDTRIRYVTRIVDCTPDELAIEMPMEVVFRDLSFRGVEGGVVAPVYRPVTSKLASASA